MNSPTGKGSFFKDKNSEFKKDNAQLNYSLVLIFLIPLAIMANIFLSIYQSQKIFNLSAQNQAILSESILTETISDSLTNEQALNEKINNVTALNSQIQEISILKPVEDGFIVFVSTNENKRSKVYKSAQYSSVFISGQNFSASTTNENNQRAQIILSPLKDNGSKNVALLQMQIDLSAIDTINQRNLIQTLIILIITILFVLLVLFNHFKLFKYALLLNRLKEVDKMKDDFISMASHELKNPMAAIRGYMGMILEGVAGKYDQKAKDHLLKISANISRLDALINSLLDVSRIEQGRMQFDMQAVDITKSVENIISDLQGQADEKKLMINYQPMPQPHPFIFADPERLNQIFNNIIGNAIKYTQKGKITITHRVENNNLITFISDTGIGMSSVDMRGLFTKFYRIQNEKTVDIPGTGLGLWITKEIVNKMNGEITAQSWEGKGTTITIKFPIMKEK